MKPPHDRVDALADLRTEARFVLAGLAYQRGTPRIVSRDLSGFTYLAATRHGLFAIRESGHRRIAHGLFYGVTVEGPHIYAFEAGDRPRTPNRRGRIVRFRRERDTIVAADVIADGLDNGCHQIDIVRGELLVVDTYNQAIVAMALDGGARRVLHPLPRIAGVDDAAYVHVNSLIAYDDRVLLLLHNSTRQSEVAAFDRDWRLVDRWPLAGRGCHNFALLEDGTLLSCGSLDGALIGSDGRHVKLGDMMTRGLSVDATRILVGGSTFSPRDTRDRQKGAVYFLDRDLKMRMRLTMPGPVTEIRRIDGQDRSLSPFLAAQPARAAA